MPDTDSVREALEALCLKFGKDKTHYLSKGYPESQVRIDFLNPLFNILGWDIANTAQKPPHERDVIVEASSEATGRPDYNFRIKGVTKFFVEAKSPLTNLSDARHILQAKSYAWSTKGVFFVILTNYAEFKLFDASLKPNPRFPEEGLIYDLKYTEYTSNIGKLLELSRERVEGGSLEALMPKDVKSKRLRIPPDKSFLEDLTAWRTELAKDIHKRNPGFDVKLLNDVVQKLLDRIIFIRIAEDRNIRQNRELWEIVAQWKGEGRRKPIMANLKNLFYRINDDLNGNIFKAHACEEADIDSGLLAEIIESVKQGGAIIKGSIRPSRAFEFPESEVRKIRENYGLSQDRFASLMGISVATLRNWEQGRRKPEGAARVLLMVAAKHPEVLLELTGSQNK